MVARWVCLVMLCLPLSYGIKAQELLELHMPDAPPLTLTSVQGRYGMVGDVALAAIAQAGYRSHIAVAPWARAQQDVSRAHNQLIIPLSRTPQREALYTWIAPIMPLERAFFSLDTPVSDFAEARRRYQRIAVGLGTAQLEILKTQGFSDKQLYSLKLGDNAPRMLEMGRIDAWFTGVEEGLYLSPQSKRTLKMSPTLASADLYLACSKSCDAELVSNLRNAVDALRADGSLQKILSTYRPAR